MQVESGITRLRNGGGDLLLQPDAAVIDFTAHRETETNRVEPFFRGISHPASIERVSEESENKR